MESAGWTAADLARRADISPSTVTRILRGRAEGEPYGLGELVALKIERATFAAWSRGEVPRSLVPLRAVDLRSANAA